MNQHIRKQLGRCSGLVVIVDVRHIKPRRSEALKEGFSNEIIEKFGNRVNALTANEAQYLVGFRSADEIRNRLFKAQQEIDIRLRSKGIKGIFGTQDS